MPIGALIGDGRMYVFTTRADTIMGVTFCAVAPEHPLAAHAARTQRRAGGLHRRVQDRRHHRSRAGHARKKGMTTGLFVHAPAHRRSRCDVWVGNDVLMGYGDGAVMGVPAHDERDFAFAKKYGIDDQAGRRRRGRNFSLRALGRIGMATSSAA